MKSGAKPAARRTKVRGLIARIFAGRAPEAQARLSVEDRLARLDADIDRGIADARARWLARPPRAEHERFSRARPKVAELKHAIAMQHVEL